MVNMRAGTDRGGGQPAGPAAEGQVPPEAAAFQCQAPAPPGAAAADVPTLVNTHVPSAVPAGIR